MMDDARNATPRRVEAPLGRWRRAAGGGALAALASLAFAGLALDAAPASGQEEPGGGAGAAADSASVRAAARDAQHAFERARVRLAPWASPFGVPRGSCDETVGRFCFWHESPNDPWRAPPEPAALTAARDSLLSVLDAAAARIPGDGWVAGQRVRYRAEAGRLAESAAAATECRAEPAWCRALAGYARHAAGDAAGAEAAFDAALAGMPEPDRSKWQDLELVLPADARPLWREADALKRAELARRAWWLADPLWSTPGNERRAEHFARHVLDRLQEDARSGYDVRWGDDLRELLVRYGWPAGFERTRDRRAALGAPGPDGVVAHDPPGARGFLPPRVVLEAPDRVAPGAWRIDAPEPRAAYAPAYADRFLELEPQVALFRRDPAVVVVAGWALPADSLAADAATETAAVVAADPDAPPRMARARGRGPEGRVSVVAPSAPAVLSIEVRAPGERLAARARHGLPLPAAGRPALSDLLLLAPGGALPAGLEEAAARVRTGAGVVPGERVGVYWEGYPPVEPGKVRWSMALRDERGGFWRGLAASLRLAGPAGEEVGLEWSEVLDGDARISRAIDVALPSRLPEGDYALVLTARFEGHPPVTAERAIRVADPR